MPDTVQHTPAVTGRIIGIDVARGIALLAMIIAHLYPLKGFAGAFLEGFPSALFAVLSGISMTIIFSKRGAVDVFIRGAILVLIGIVVTPKGFQGFPWQITRQFINIACLCAGRISTATGM